MLFRFCFLTVACLGISAALMADVLVDNFDDNQPSQTTLGWNIEQSLTHSAHTGYWYGFTDKDDKGNSTLSPDVYTVDKQFKTANVTGGINGTKCVHITMTLGNAFVSPYSAIGFQINVQPSPYQDLSAMTGLTFWAKGSGAVRVKFLTDKVTNGYTVGKNWGDMGAEVTLTADWKLFTIKVADIKPQPYSPQATDKLTWAQCMNKCDKIHFQTSPTMVAGEILDLSLDEIRMQGVTPQTFGGTWTETGVYRVADTRRLDPMEIIANAGVMTVVLPSSGSVSAEVYSLSGGLVQKYFSQASPKAAFQLPVTSGKYVARIVSKSGAMTVPISIEK